MGDLRAWPLVAVLTAVQLASSVYLNRVVLGPELLASMMAPAAGSVGMRSATAIEIVTYALIPVGLLVRVGLVSLLVQLVLRAFVRTPPLGRIFRAALWAQFAVVLAGLAQAIWLATLPPAAWLQGPATPIGSLAAFLPTGLDPGPRLLALARQVGVFDVAWIVLFATALEDGPRIPARFAVASVGVVWTTIVLARWVAFHYLV